ncbi:hypothetical protein [Ornithinibacillus scapharcae]|uniref:hypothetical protein n=1 Tax=Ornithinibacillus scapharcae TaxID=1147159 RepID=UPI000225AB4A|nr:hypothetical protein [Ornithinibacillus scapharcae]
MRNFFMIFSISFLICTFLAGCSENDDSIPELLDDNWEKKTITKIVENGYADGMFVDYSEANKISYTMDDLWRTLEIYNSIGYNYQQDLLLEKIINLELNGLKEELQFSYLCFKYLDNGCSIEIEINPTIEEILNSEYDTMETLDLVYFIVSYYYDNINNNSKINIMKWIESNATVIKKDIGLIYTVLSIQDKMGVEIIEFENRELYKHLLKNTIEEPDSDLIELYYLYFINYYLQNEIDENYVFTGVLKYFDQDSGFSLSKHYYLDANLGTFIAINILNEIGKIGSLKKDIMTIAEKLETNYGLFINKENIPTGTIEETIMGYYVLQILGEVKK